jgi:hypothetical protein
MMKPALAISPCTVGVVRGGSNVDCLWGVEVSWLWFRTALVLLDFRNTRYIIRNLVWLTKCPLCDAICFPPSQEISRHLCNSKVHYRHAGPLLSHINPLNSFHPISLRRMSLLLAHVRLGLSVSLFPSVYLTKTPCAFLSSLVPVS